MKHIMIDIETMSTKQNASIVSIGAVYFDFEQDGFGKEFYVTVDLDSCIRRGLSVDKGTIEFWMRQPDHVRIEIFKNNIGLLHALLSLREFIEKDCFVWGNPSTFDISLLTHSYNVFEEQVPWSYRNIRDLRTIVSLAPQIKEQLKFTGDQHHPIWDCKHQITYLKQIAKQLNLNFK